MESTHHRNIRIKNQLANQGFIAKPVYNNQSNVSGLEEYLEPWRFSLVVVSDGTSPFYRMEKGTGWSLNYVRFKEVPSDIDLNIGDDEEIIPGEKIEVNYLAPGTVLRTIVITDRIIEMPGICAAFGITKPNQERTWTILPVLPIATA